LLKIINKGLVFDETARTQKLFIKTISKIISAKDINCLIVTGAPFSLLYFGTIVKSKFPQIKLISDFRDGWTQGTGYGIKALSPIKYSYELEREKQVLRVSDHVLVATEDIKMMLKNVSLESDPIVLPNFVDFTRQIKYREKKVKSFNEIIITHIGSVNVGTEKYWMNYFNIVSDLNSNSILYKTQFIGNTNKELEDFVRTNKVLNVDFYPRVDISELSNCMYESDFFLFFKHDEFPNSFPTKFYDYIFFRKPMICFSKKGAVTQEIITNKIGYVFNEHSTKEDLYKIFSSYVSKELNFNPNYDWSKFSLENCVLKLEKLF
jgi:hypothetical protein